MKTLPASCAEGSIIHLHLCSFKCLENSHSPETDLAETSGCNTPEMGGHFEFHFLVILWKISGADF